VYAIFTVYCTVSLNRHVYIFQYRKSISIEVYISLKEQIAYIINQFQETSFYYIKYSELYKLKFSPPISRVYQEHLKACRSTIQLLQYQNAEKSEIICHHKL